jgi:GNAT superfamily N-acetyltransferase
MDIKSSIRPARDGDAGAVSQVISSALRETNAKDYAPEIIARIEKSFSPAAVQELIRKRKVFVAVLGQQIVGTASLDGKTVRSVFVAPNAQGQGIGRQLLAEVERAARDVGITALVVPSSVTAEQFTPSLGLKRCATATTATSAPLSWNATWPRYRRQWGNSNRDATKEPG